jgi:hypothetical protein
MATQTDGVTTLPGQESVWHIAPGRAAALKLQSGQTRPWQGDPGRHGNGGPSGHDRLFAPPGVARVHEHRHRAAVCLGDDLATRGGECLSRARTDRRDSK